MTHSLKLTTYQRAMLEARAEYLAWEVATFGTRGRRIHVEGRAEEGRAEACHAMPRVAA